tara:strand:+ start:62 stop:433 length:372 start_codon:yes stop_codon:yes gene_type:complete
MKFNKVVEKIKDRIDILEERNIFEIYDILKESIGENLSLENDKFCCSEDDKFVVFGWGDRLEFSGFDFFKFDYEVYEYIDNLFEDYECIDDVFDNLDCYKDWKKDFVYFDMYECDSFIIVKLK